DGNFRAAVGQLLFDLGGVFLGEVFLHRLRRAFDDVLGFLEAEARDFADDLDDVDLLGRIRNAFEDDAEFSRRFGGHGGGRATGGRRDHRAAAARGGLDLVDVFEVVTQLDGLGDGQGRDLIANVFDFRSPC